MDFDARVDLKIELWPSIKEIQDSDLKSEYLGGLTEYYDSLDKLRNDAMNSAILFEEYEYIGVNRGRQAHGFMPPEIAEIIFYLGSSGMALALYKLMRLWVDTINGRKLRVKIDNVEIEATQLSEKKFLKLLEVLRTREKQRLEKPLPDNMDEFLSIVKQENTAFKNDLLRKDFEVIDSSNEKVQAEKHKIKIEVQKSINKKRGY